MPVIICSHQKTTITHTGHHMTRNCLDCGHQEITEPQSDLQRAIGQYLKAKPILK